MRKTPMNGTVIPVRPWLFICLITAIIGAIGSYLYLYFTEQYLPVINLGIVRASPSPSPTPQVPAVQLVQSTPVYNYAATSGTPAANNSSTAPLFMRGRSPFPVIDFGPNTRVLTYEPEFVTGGAVIGNEGNLYVAYMYALLEFAVVGAGAPEPNKLAMLTGGALRPIPTPWLPNSTVFLSFKSQSDSPLVFNAGGDDYFLDYDGMYRLPQRQPDVDLPHVDLSAGEKCITPLDKHRAVLDALAPNGQRRILIAMTEFKRLGISPHTTVDCYHFARRNIFQISPSGESAVYVESNGHLNFVIHGSVQAANGHRLLITSDAGGNHAWFLEGFAP